jgi:hypothetical protein
MQPDEVTIEQLLASGFSDQVIERRRRLVASIEGLEGTGKTHFSCTAPGPIIYFNIDIGTEGVVEKFQTGFEGQPAKRILIKDIKVPKSAEKDTYEALWESLRQDAETAYKLKSGTVVLDTTSEAYELCRLARFGRLTQVLPHMYTLSNNDWREFLRLAYDSHMNTILIHKVKPKYVNNVRTSEYEIAGMSEIPFLVQVRLSMFRTPGAEGEAEFGFKVLKCRPNDPLTGRSFSGPLCNFPFLLNMAHGKEKK